MGKHCFIFTLIFTLPVLYFVYNKGTLNISINPRRNDEYKEKYDSHRQSYW